MLSHEKSLLLGYGWALLSVCLWATIAPLSKLCQQAGMPPQDIAFWRALLGGLCFAVQSAWQGQLRVPLWTAGSCMAFGVVGVGVFFTVLQAAIQLSGAAVSMILMYTAPIWVAIFARVLFHEPLSRWKLACMTAALCGTGMVCLSGGSLPASFSAVGIACGLASGLCYALHFPFFVWWKERCTTAVIYTYMLLGGVLALFPFFSYNGGYEPIVWLYAVALGFITNYLAYYAYGQCLRRIPQVSAAVIGNVEPLLATFLVWQFWGENFTPLGWVGGACILIAVLCITLEPQRTKQRH